MVVVAIIVGVVVLAVVVIFVACFYCSQRTKRENAAALAVQEAPLEEETMTELPHRLLVSPNAPTYNSSFFSGGSVPLAIAVPSAPTADLDDQVMSIEIQLQQREFDRYARERAQRQNAPPPEVPRSTPPPGHQPHQPRSLPQDQHVPQPQQPTQQPGAQPQPWDDPIFVASRIPMEALFTTELISRGGFGEVYKGSYRGQNVAMKKLLPETRRDLKHIAGFFSEIKLTATMEHERIVRYIGVAWDALSDVCVVTEFMEGGDLRSLLTRFESVDKRPQGFDKQKATIALHVAHALTYMHSLQPVVLHRDLKSKNILLDESQWNAKLTDFGVSRERSDNTMTAAVGTILWMAPEVMAGDRYDDKADVFSLGIVLSELDTHSMPYADVRARLVSDNGRAMPETALLQRIMTGRVSVTFSSALPEDIRSLFQSCVSLDPTARPTAAQLLYELHKISNSL